MRGFYISNNPQVSIFLTTTGFYFLHTHPHPLYISDRGNPHCFGTHAIMTDTSLTPANINPSMTFVWLCNVSIEDYFTVFSFESLFSVSYYILWEIIDYLTDFEMKTKINKHLKLIWFFWGGTLVKFLEQIKRDTGGMFYSSYFDNSKVIMFDGWKVSFWGKQYSIEENLT